jgi:hypothetical protein
MNYKFAILAMLLLAVSQAGCAIYPVSRTFYAPREADGKLRNQTACGYLRTRDTVEITSGDITVAVTVGGAKVPENSHAAVTVVIDVQGPTGSANLRTQDVLLTLPLATLRPSVSSSVASPGSNSSRQVIRWTLTYPGPAGLSDNVEVHFEPGALTEDGKPINVGPLHFKRVKETDLYYGSISC